MKKWFLYIHSGETGKAMRRNTLICACAFAGALYFKSRILLLGALILTGLNLIAFLQVYFESRAFKRWLLNEGNREWDDEDSAWYAFQHWRDVEKPKERKKAEWKDVMQELRSSSPQTESSAKDFVAAFAKLSVGRGQDWTKLANLAREFCDLPSCGAAELEHVRQALQPCMKILMERSEKEPSAKALVAAAIESLSTELDELKACGSEARERRNQAVTEALRRRTEISKRRRSRSA